MSLEGSENDSVANDTDISSVTSDRPEDILDEDPGEDDNDMEENLPKPPLR